MINSSELLTKNDLQFAIIIRDVFFIKILSLARKVNDVTHHLNPSIWSDFETVFAPESLRARKSSKSCPPLFRKYLFSKFYISVNTVFFNFRKTLHQADWGCLCENKNIFLMAALHQKARICFECGSKFWRLQKFFISGLKFVSSIHLPDFRYFVWKKW